MKDRLSILDAEIPGIQDLLRLHQQNLRPAVTPIQTSPVGCQGGDKLKSRPTMAEVSTVSTFLAFAIAPCPAKYRN